MIERMKKISLLVFYKDKEAFLIKLQELGMVHLDVKSDVSSELLSRLKKDRSICQKALSIVKQYKPQKQTEAPGTPQPDNDENLQRRILDLKNEIEVIHLEIGEREKERRMLEPWGEFSWEHINRLNNAGVKIRFFYALKNNFESLDLKDIHYSIIHQTNKDVYFAVFEKDSEVQLKRAERLHLPQKTLSEVNAEIKTLANRADAALYFSRSITKRN